MHTYWKMSIDLRRPLVMSEGNLDPVDCLAPYKLLQESAPGALSAEISGARALMRLCSA